MGPLGAKIRANPVDPGRSLDTDPFYWIGITGFPSSGSVYEPWDAGAGYNALAPNSNTPPVGSPQNRDPHGVPRRTTAAQHQKSEHMKPAGTITDQCAGVPCDGVP